MIYRLNNLKKMKHIKIYEAFSDAELSSEKAMTELNYAMQNPDESKPFLFLTSEGTSIIGMVSKETSKMGGSLIDIDSSLINPEDMVLPSSYEGASSSLLLPTDNGYMGHGGVVLFTEINRSNKQVLNSIMRLAVNRRIENYVLPDKWVIAVTAKGSESTDLGAALEDRFKVFSI